jgi:hypothetical protein
MTTPVDKGEDSIPHQEITYKIIGAAMRVHRRMPRGLPERHYQKALTDEIAQVIAYLAATSAKVGLLLNFGRHRLEYRRILPPRTLLGWQSHIAKYLWKPKGSGDDNP